MSEARKVDERSNWSLMYFIEHIIVVESSSMVIALLGRSNRTWWQWRRDTNRIAAIERGKLKVSERARSQSQLESGME